MAAGHERVQSRVNVQGGAGERHTVTQGMGRKCGGRHSILLVRRPKGKLTFPVGPHSPRWDWPGGCQWPKSVCATGYRPGECSGTCSSRLPLHRFYKGNAGGSLRASVPEWASPVPFLPSCPSSASSLSSFPFPNPTRFFSPIVLASSRWRYIRFSARQEIGLHMKSNTGSYW